MVTNQYQNANVMSAYPERLIPIIMPRGEYHRRHFSSATFDIIPASSIATIGSPTQLASFPTDKNKTINVTLA
jgi:hypothetical protein